MGGAGRCLAGSIDVGVDQVFFLYTSRERGARVTVSTLVLFFAQGDGGGGVRKGDADNDGDNQSRRRVGRGKKGSRAEI